jgi:hypothetical protein
MYTSEMTLLALLRDLEEEIHTSVANINASRLDALLHEDFLEFGRSGRTYIKQDIMAQLSSSEPHVPLFADHFEVRRLSKHIALLTYRSANQLTDGTLDRFTLRTSVWEESQLGW